MKIGDTPQKCPIWTTLVYTYSKTEETACILNSLFQSYGFIDLAVLIKNITPFQFRFNLINSLLLKSERQPKNKSLILYSQRVLLDFRFNFNCKNYTH